MPGLLWHDRAKRAVSPGDPTSPEADPGVLARVAIGRKCLKLRFLHAEWDGGNPPNGTEVAHYLVHYTNGQVERIPLRNGLELADMGGGAQPEETPQYTIAWSGPNERSRQITAYSGNRVFKATWVNPHPD